MPITMHTKLTGGSTSQIYATDISYNTDCRKGAILTYNIHITFRKNGSAI
jgi:hypothetical protein